MSVPVIASGGAGCKADFVKLFQTIPTIDAGLAAYILHFGEVDIYDLKNELEEITICSTYKLKYEDILKMKLLRSVLFIYISPVRIIIIPKRDSYDIKEIYSELNNLRKIKNTKVLSSD